MTSDIEGEEISIWMENLSWGLEEVREMIPDGKRKKRTRTRMRKKVLMTKMKKKRTVKKRTRELCEWLSVLEEIERDHRGWDFVS
jgi:hypothetical protein